MKKSVIKNKWIKITANGKTAYAQWEDCGPFIYDDFNYVFEGKTLLNDFFKILKLDDDIFDDAKGDADTLAGLILELAGEIPKAGKTLKFKNFVFKVISSDIRRIKQIKVTYHPHNDNEHDHK